MSYPLFQLGPRLQLCASLVRPEAKLADIGTDHAYLPVWLARNELISHAVASDVNPGPLKHANLNVERYGVSGIVETRLSDGLLQIMQEEADDIVIAGMGGELIAKIISAVSWLQSPKKRLVLQPMTSAEELRAFLAENGYAVLQEAAVIDDSRVYSAFLVQHSPEKVKADELYPYIGLLSGKDEAEREYIRLRIQNLKKRADGLALKGDQAQSVALERIIELLRDPQLLIYRAEKLKSKEGTKKR